MSEEIFHFPGRYRLARDAGELILTLWLGGSAHRFPLAPRQGYALLMGRRRTELLYAIAVAKSDAGEVPDAELISLCTGGSEAEISALATYWNRDGSVAAVLAEVLGQPISPGRWFAPRRRAAKTRKEKAPLC